MRPPLPVRADGARANLGPEILIVRCGEINALLLCDQTSHLPAVVGDVNSDCFGHDQSRRAGRRTPREFGIDQFVAGRYSSTPNAVTPPWLPVRAERSSGSETALWETNQQSRPRAPAAGGVQSSSVL